MRLVEFILNHLEILIPVAILIISGLGGATKKKAGGSSKMPPPQQLQQREAEERRVREIQEEIRRKIAERTGAGGAVLSPKPTAQRSQSRPLQSQTRSREPQRSSQSGHKEYGRVERPAQQEVSRKFMPEHDKQHGIPNPVGHPRQQVTDWAAKVAEQERLVEEQLQQAKRLQSRLKRKDSKSDTPMGGDFPSAHVDKMIPMQGTRAALLRDLRSTQGQRRAILLREILDKPIGMRKPGTSVI